MKIQPRHAAILSVFVLIAAHPSGFAQSTESLKTIENQYLAAFEIQVQGAHLAKVAELDGKYLGALEKAVQVATRDGRIKEALALRAELERVKAKQPCPNTEDGVAPDLAKLRRTYGEQLAKLMAARTQAAAPILKKFEGALAAYQEQVSRAGNLDEAAAVLAYREAGVAAKLLGIGADPVEPDESAPSDAGGSSAIRDPALAAATKEKPFENSLGMKFVPVKGTDVFFCIHETRWGDYAEYAAANPSIATNWKNQTHRGFRLTEREEDHPVVYVSWEDATAFCKWLSEKEKKTYRLPTDREWSIAVGLGRKEKWRKGDTPASVSRDPDEFPWGKDWPPPKGAGNYSDQSCKAKAPDPGTQYLDGYDDGFPTTAPVMSFAPNEFGLYDMGGNVWEWVEDWWTEAKTDRVLRGDSWNGSERGNLLSSYRNHDIPDARYNSLGFRLVLVVSGG